MDFLNASGPLIWLVLIFGLLALTAATRYAFQHAARQLPAALGASVATLVTALLATVLGFQRSVAHLGEVAADRRWIYLVGLEESLNNVVVALVVGLLVSLLLTVGAYRQSGVASA